MATDVKSIFVTVPLHKAIELVTAACGQLVTVTRLQGAQGRECAVAVYEKYYLRMGASSVATVIFEDMGEKVKVSCVCAGSGSSPHFGANANFQRMILASLS